MADDNNKHASYPAIYLHISHIHTYSYTHIYIHLHTYIHTYIHTYTYTHIYTHTHTADDSNERASYPANNILAQESKTEKKPF